VTLYSGSFRSNRGYAAGVPLDLPPSTWTTDAMHRALHERNVGAVFRLLTERHGVSQRWIAGAVGMSQSEVSEIVKGRRVRMVDVLERV